MTNIDISGYRQNGFSQYRNFWSSVLSEVLSNIEISDPGNHGFVQFRNFGISSVSMSENTCFVKYRNYCIQKIRAFVNLYTFLDPFLVLANIEILKSWYSGMVYWKLVLVQYRNPECRFVQYRKFGILTIPELSNINVSESWACRVCLIYDISGPQKLRLCPILKFKDRAISVLSNIEISRSQQFRLTKVIRFYNTAKVVRFCNNGLPISRIIW